MNITPVNISNLLLIIFDRQIIMDLNNKIQEK